MKKIQRINAWLKISIAVVGVLFFILHLINSSAWPKLASYLVTIVLPVVPEIFAKFKIKLSTRLQLFYYLFLVIAMIGGIDLELYRDWAGFDKVVHCASGALVAVWAREVLEHYFGNLKSWHKLKNGKKQREFVVLFTMAFVAMIALLWECFEFGYDQLCGGNMQELLKPGVSDTMWDMIFAMIGGMVVNIGEILTKKNY